MPFIDEYIRGEATLTKRIIVSILFNTVITAAVIAAHWAIKTISILLGMENELSWIKSISQDHYYIFFYNTFYNKYNPIIKIRRCVYIISKYI
jgi:hypothetical protein